MWASSFRTMPTQPIWPINTPAAPVAKLFGLKP
jgi:hypothetical protein